jgi:hypothetical protein
MESDDEGKELYYSLSRVKGQRKGYKDSATTHMGSRKITKDAVPFGGGRRSSSLMQNTC